MPTGISPFGSRRRSGWVASFFSAVKEVACNTQPAQLNAQGVVVHVTNVVVQQLRRLSVQPAG